MNEVLEKVYVGDYLVEELPRMLESKIEFLKEQEKNAISRHHETYLKGRREMAETILESVMAVVGKIKATEAIETDENAAE